MKGITRSALLLATFFGMGACQAGRTIDVAPSTDRTVVPAKPHARRETGDSLTPERIAGDWAFHEACGDRHAVTVTLTPRGRHVTGTWDDGTVIHGSSGLLEGRIVGRRLDAALCTGTDYADDGRVQTCTTTGFHGDYFLLRGDRLVWMKDDGQRQAPYVMLDRPGHAPAQSAVVTPTICNAPSPASTHATSRVELPTSPSANT